MATLVESSSLLFSRSCTLATCCAQEKHSAERDMGAVVRLSVTGIESRLVSGTLPSPSFFLRGEINVSTAKGSSSSSSTLLALFSPVSVKGST